MVVKLKNNSEDNMSDSNQISTTASAKRNNTGSVPEFSMNLTWRFNG